MPNQGSRPPTQRQLKVGEELRNALAQVFMLGETHDPVLDSASITVSEVRISPDLKNATVFFLPLAGSKKDVVLNTLKDNAGRIRSLMSKHIVLRHTPRLFFKLDDSFEKANRINELLQSDRVKADLEKAAQEKEQE